MYINSDVFNVNFTFTSPVNHSNHTIDQFMVSSALYDHITTYQSMHDDDNVSFHSAINLQFEINVSYLNNASRNYVPRAKWANSSEDNLLDYGETLDNLLSSLSIPRDALQ